MVYLMKTLKLRQLTFGASCLLCSGLTLARTLDMIGTEEGGGSVTGPVIKASVAGGGLLIAAIFIMFFKPRIAAGVAIFAALLCVPLYFYTVEPKAFLALFTGYSAVQHPDGFIWNDWAIAGSSAAALAVIVGVWNLLAGPRVVNSL
jgi:hypothetical protein